MVEVRLNIDRELTLNMLAQSIQPRLKQMEEYYIKSNKYIKYFQLTIHF